jgi:hypothetical protein
VRYSPAFGAWQRWFVSFSAGGQSHWHRRYREAGTLAAAAQKLRRTTKALRLRLFCTRIASIAGLK